VLASFPQVLFKFCGALGMFRCLFLALTLVGFACGQTPIQGADLFAGCYEVRSLSWSPQPEETIALIPKQFQLLRAPTPSSKFFGMRSMGAGAGRNPLENGWAWRPRGGDGLEIIWSTGFGGFRGTLKKSAGDDLAGRVKEWCDSRCGWKKETGSIRVHRIVCDPN
jgi:hypothetical protein